MKGLVVQVALKGATFAFDKLYTYAVPLELYGKAKAGCRVTVPFGRGNTTRQGMIFTVSEQDVQGLKKIISLTDEEPVLSDEMLKLADYMRETVFCTYYDAVSVMIPAGLGFKTVNFYSANGEFSAFSLLSQDENVVFQYLLKKGETEEAQLKTHFGVSSEFLDSLSEKEALVKISDLKRRVGDATQKWVHLSEEFDEQTKLTARQKEVVSLLEEIGSAAVKEICYFRRFGICCGKSY